MLELIPHLLEHAFEDTIYLVPFLLVTYFLLEALEHKAGNRTEELVQKAGRLGPAVAAVLGAFPNAAFPPLVLRCFPAGPSLLAPSLRYCFPHPMKCCRCSSPNRLIGT